MPNDLLNKLIKEERTINIYKKTDSDIIRESLLEEINIDIIPLETLKSIITPNPDDPLLFDGYPLEVEEFNKINALINNRITPNFELYDYVMECYGIYDWDKK